MRRFLRYFLLFMAGWILVVLVGVALFFAFGPKLETGEAALRHMTPQQRALAERLASLPASIAVSDLNLILGPPIQDISVRVKWKDPVKPEHARITAYFIAGKVSKITYISVDPYWGWTLYAEGDRLTDRPTK